jgi:glutamate/tyrosine decarboxylase-like PLP-dependent enzyme
MDRLIDAFSDRAKKYLKLIETRDVFPETGDIDNLKHLNIQLQDDKIDPLQVLEELDRFGSPATVASSGGRYFGFVVGGTLPAPLAANLLANVWDQNAGMEASSPVSAFIETLSRKWLIDIFDLPKETEVGFVTGATMANFTGLAVARHALLKKNGWDVENYGLFNAPEIKVIVGEEVHVSILKALSMLGMGKSRVTKVPVDSQGRMKPECIPEITGPTIICVQAGNVNTGAFDPIDEICNKVSGALSWVHVDGAFGLWARVTPKYEHLVRGMEKADSWATDAHKWLNVPYDSGLVFVKEKEHLVSAMATNAAYLVSGGKREPCCCVPELSRRGRGIEVWAALRSLGKKGLAQLIESNCKNAFLFADMLSTVGYDVLNDVVLNQVLVSFGEPDVTRRVIKRVQEDGTCWCGGTEWQGKTAMRISVSSWKTTEKDIKESARVIIRIADEENNRVYEDKNIQCHHICPANIQCVPILLCK